MEYPLADEYTINDKTNLDRITVSDITHVSWRKTKNTHCNNTPLPARETWAQASVRQTQNPSLVFSLTTVTLCWPPSRASRRRAQQAASLHPSPSLPSLPLSPLPHAPPPAPPTYTMASPGMETALVELEAALTEAVSNALRTLKQQGAPAGTPLHGLVGQHLLGEVKPPLATASDVDDLVAVVDASIRDRLGLTEEPDEQRLGELKKAYLKQMAAEAQRLKGTAAQVSLSQIDVSKLPLTAYHITGLLDNEDLPTMRLALLDAASNPSHDESRKFTRSDLSTWSYKNLKELSAQELAELQGPAALELEKTGRKFDSIINMPLNILSLAHKHGHLEMPDFIFPYDKYALTHSASGINE